jgi:hypothetical protein
MGDFNLPNIDWVHYSATENPFYDMFIQFVNNFGLHQYVLVPTRFSASGTNNILDLVFTDMYNLVSDLEVLCPFSTSDHNMVKFSVNIPCKSNTSSVDDELFYDFKNANYEMMELYLCSIDWVYEFSFVFNVEDYYSILLNHLSYAIQLYVPLKKMPKPGLYRAKRYPKKVRQLLNHKARMWKRWRVSRDILAKRAYESYAIKCKNAINQYQSDLEHELVLSNDLGKFYRFVNNKLSSHVNTPPVKGMHGNLVSNPTDKSNLFNQYFASVFTVDDGKSPVFPLRTSNGCIMNDVCFTPAKVINVLKSLKPKSSCGPDGIPSMLFKRLAHALGNPLAFILEYSFRSHVLPAYWLHAIVTPIFKKGLTSDTGNYRPISLTCVSCRVMERIINLELINYLLEHGLISKCQHGFLRKHSTCTVPTYLNR